MVAPLSSPEINVDLIPTEPLLNSLSQVSLVVT